MNAAFSKTLIGELNRHFEKEGYELRKNPPEFQRRLQDGDLHAIGVALLPASKSGFFKAATSLHIRIRDIEDVYAKYHPQLKPHDCNEHFTININCDNLFSDKAVSQSYELASNEDVIALATRLWQAISRDVLSFFEKYGNRHALVENLVSEDYRSWITSDRFARYLVLISDRVLSADPSGFEKYATELLEYCEKPHGQMYLQAAQTIVNGLRAQ